MAEDILAHLETLDVSFEDLDSIWVKLNNMIHRMFLPEQNYGEDRPLVENDFITFKENVDNLFCTLHTVLSKLFHIRNELKSSRDAPLETFEIRRDIVMSAMVLFGEHSLSHVWTTVDSCRLAAECSGILCQLCECNCPSQLLIGMSSKQSGRIFKEALLFLRPKLLKETWRRFPGAVSAYRWMLTQVHSPHLSEYINLVVPTALIILDDHIIERRLIGLSCVNHIINNVTRTELCQQGFHNVIFKALEHILLMSDAEQIQPTVTCLTDLLQMTERGYTRSSEPGMWDRFDDIMKLILHKMPLEDRIALRKAYIKSLGTLILAMGPSIIRWSKVLLSVIDEYLHKESHDTRSDALKVLLIYLQLSKPRLNRNGNQILFLLLRTLYDVSIDKRQSSSGSTDILKTIEECFSLLKTVVPDRLNDMKAEISEITCNPLMKEVLCKVFPLK